MRLKGSPGLARVQDRDALVAAHADLSHHVANCVDCATGYVSAGPRVAYQYSSDTWELLQPERFCTQGRVYLTEAAQRGHAMLKAVI